MHSHAFAAACAPTAYMVVLRRKLEAVDVVRNPAKAEMIFPAVQAEAAQQRQRACLRGEELRARHATPIFAANAATASADTGFLRSGSLCSISPAGGAGSSPPRITWSRAIS